MLTFDQGSDRTTCVLDFSRFWAKTLLSLLAPAVCPHYESRREKVGSGLYTTTKPTEMWVLGFARRRGFTRQET